MTGINWQANRESVAVERFALCFFFFAYCSCGKVLLRRSGTNNLYFTVATWTVSPNLVPNPGSILAPDLAQNVARNFAPIWPWTRFEAQLKRSLQNVSKKKKQIVFADVQKHVVNVQHSI